MYNVIPRRGFLTTSALVAGTVALSPKTSAQTLTWPGFQTNAIPHEKPFMNQFYEGMLNIARGIRDTQMDNIAGAMEKAYELRQKGGNIYSNHIYGHTPQFALNINRPGQPWLLPSPGNRFLKKEDYDSMKRGDFVLTFRNSFDKGETEARDRGVFIVGVTNSYFRFYKTPPKGLTPERMENTFEDYSDIVIDSQVPWENGLVSSPWLHFKFCPSTSTASFLVYWACTASLANLIGTGGKGSSSEPAKRYLDLACERYEMIGTDRPKVDQVTEKWADLVLGKKGRIFIYGHTQNSGDANTGRLGNMFVDEATGAGSAQGINPYRDVIKDPEKNLAPEDIVIIGALSSDNDDEIDVARHVKLAGAYTVAFCPYRTEGDNLEKRLFREVDVSFNTYSDERAGALEIKGFKEKICPLTGVTGNLVHWMLTAQWADHMASRGEMPYFRLGMNYDGGEYNRTIVVPNTKKRAY